MAAADIHNTLGCEQITSRRVDHEHQLVFLAQRGPQHVFQHVGILVSDTDREGERREERHEPAFRAEALFDQPIEPYASSMTLIRLLQDSVDNRVFGRCLGVVRCHAHRD